jgi:hypothetical protein
MLKDTRYTIISENYPLSYFHLKHNDSETGFCLRQNLQTPIMSLLLALFRELRDLYMFNKLDEKKMFTTYTAIFWVVTSCGLLFGAGYIQSLAVSTTVVVGWPPLRKKPHMQY